MHLHLSPLARQQDHGIAHVVVTYQIPVELDHGQRRGGTEGERESMRRFRKAIPDACFRIDDCIAEGDRVVVRLTVTGTPVEAFPPIEPGEPMEFRAVAIFRIEDGLVAEEWFYRDAGTGSG